LIWLDAFTIPADAPHPEEAHTFIDYMLRPEIAARNSNFVNYANGNKPRRSSWMKASGETRPSIPTKRRSPSFTPQRQTTSAFSAR
jgi:spermidine/putrescine-binding protein